MRRIVVAVSGGVDSAVAAHLLLAEGWEVIGATFLLQTSPDASSGGEAARRTPASDAREVCRCLGIEHVLVPLQQQFHREVVAPFIQGYLRGETPNPCVICNPRVKFDTLLRLAADLGAEAIATGHYARVAGPDDTGRYLLLAAAAPERDQSYFLYALGQVHLSRARFPLGRWQKSAVRALARRMRLPVHDKRDSQEICFIPENDYAAFLERHAPDMIRPGPVTDTTGRIVGQHKGIHRFTIGQRKGLGIAFGKPRYVVRLDPHEARVVVGEYADTLRRACIVRDVNWIAARPSDGRLAAVVRIRSTHRGAEAWVEPLDDGASAKVEFLEPQSAITPGQAAVFYQGETVLGGGIIARTVEEE